MKRLFASGVFAAYWLLGEAARAEVASTSPEQGYNAGEVEQTRSTAMGGAQNALGGSTTALFNNPANLALRRVYHFEALAAWSPEARRQSYGGAIADSLTSRVAGGVGFVWNQMDPSGIRRTWSDLRLGLAYPVSDRFSLGVTTRYLRVTQAVSRGPLGASLASDGTPDGALFNGFTLSVGATLIPTQNLHFAVVGHNITNPDTRLAPTLAGGAVGYASGIFALEGDALADFTSASGVGGRFSVGGEIFLIERIPVRAGYRHITADGTHAISLGLGYVDRAFSIEASGRRDVVADHPSTFIGLGFRYFLDNQSPEPGAE